MNASMTCPDDSQWKRLLDSNELDGDQADVLEHLESCPSCRERLERLAAEGIPWQRVALRIQKGEQQSSLVPPLLAEAIRKLQDHPLPPTLSERADVSPDLPPGFFSPPRNSGQMGCLDDYEIHEEVGRGAMGVVLRAFDPKLHRVVAIKVMSPLLASFPLARQRFVREGHSAAAVCHENVVAVHAVGERMGLPYLVMQFVAGKTLQQRIDRTGPLPVTEVLRIGIQAADGLAAAHAQGLVHRDIKPANLLLENGVERVKLTDFGLARAVDDASITQTGVITGTPQFMAPEQARGELVDARGDLFSLGCVLYSLCTGRPPFRGSSTIAVLKRVCEAEPVPIRQLSPEIPDWLVGIVMRLLAKRREDRFASAKELSELLRQCLEHWQQPALVPLPTAVQGLPQVTLPISCLPPMIVPRDWRRSPLGIIVVLAAMVLPLTLVLLNRMIDYRFGPARPASLESNETNETTRPTEATPAPEVKRVPDGDREQEGQGKEEGDAQKDR